jgi:hypothetical protein
MIRFIWLNPLLHSAMHIGVIFLKASSKGRNSDGTRLLPFSSNRWNPRIDCRPSTLSLSRVRISISLNNDDAALSPDRVGNSGQVSGSSILLQVIIPTYFRRCVNISDSRHMGGLNCQHTVFQVVHQRRKNLSGRVGMSDFWPACSSTPARCYYVQCWHSSLRCGPGSLHIALNTSIH